MVGRTTAAASRTPCTTATARSATTSASRLIVPGWHSVDADCTCPICVGTTPRASPGHTHRAGLHRAAARVLKATRTHHGHACTRTEKLVVSLNPTA